MSDVMDPRKILAWMAVFALAAIGWLIVLAVAFAVWHHYAR